MTQEAIRTYSYRISQASPTDLVVITYDMAMEYLEDGIKAYTLGDENLTNRNLKGAEHCIDQLMQGLDVQYEIGQNLFRIYLYMKRQLIKTSVSFDKELILKINSMLGKLRNSFCEISKQDDSGPLMKNTQQIYQGLTYSNGGLGNEFSNDPMKNRGFKA